MCLCTLTCLSVIIVSESKVPSVQVNIELISLCSFILPRWNTRIDTSFLNFLFPQFSLKPSLLISSPPAPRAPPHTHPIEQNFRPSSLSHTIACVHMHTKWCFCHIRGHCIDLHWLFPTLTMNATYLIPTIMAKFTKWGRLVWWDHKKALMGVHSALIYKQRRR